MADNKGPVTQWEAPSLIPAGLSVLDRVLSLVKAASQDDVQPQAVIALETLGAGCHVSSHLISEGIDALNGQESIRLKDSKALLGLVNSNVVAEFRTSTARVQAFLLSTALLSCGFNEKEISDIFYEMLSYRKLLKGNPVSRGQLRDLVKVISGHSQSLVSNSGADAIVAIVQAFQVLKTDPSLQAGSSSAYWDHLEHSTFVEIITHVFDALRDDDVQSLEISGSVDLFRVLLTLFWLNRDSVALFHKNACLLGEERSKIKIYPSRENPTQIDVPGNSNISSDDWTIRTWKRGQSVSSVVTLGNEEAPQLGAPRPHIIPAVSVYSYYSRDRSEVEMQLLGTVAAGFMEAALQYPVRFRPHKEVSEFKYLAVNSLSSLISDRPLETISIPWSILCILGWPVQHSRESHPAKLIKEEITSCIMDRASSCKYNISSTPSSSEHFLAHLKHHSVLSHIDEMFYIAAVSIATQGLLFMFVRNISSCGSTSEDPDIGKNRRDVALYYDLRWVQSCLSVGFLRAPDAIDLSIDDLRRDIYRAALTSSPLIGIRDSEVPIAVCSSGRVAILAPLLNHSVERQGALDIFLQPGMIRFEDRPFDLLVEHTNFYSTTELDLTRRSQAHKLLLSDQRFKTSYSFAEDENRLVMRTSLVPHSSTLGATKWIPQGWPVSYAACVSQLLQSVPYDQLDMDKISKSFVEKSNWRNARYSTEIVFVQTMLETGVAAKARFSKLLDGTASPTGLSFVDLPSYSELALTDHLVHVNNTAFSDQAEVRFFRCLSYLPFDVFNDQLRNYITVVRGDVSIKKCHERILDVIFDHGWHSKITQRDLLRQGFDAGSIDFTFSSVYEAVPGFRIISTMDS